MSSEAETPAEQTVPVEAKAVSKRSRAHPELEVLLERIPGYLSVREAAQIMGVSERSVYGYIGAGKLPGARIGNIIVVVEEYVEAYERKGPGRARTNAPFWRMPSLRNLEFLTTIIARIRPGQSELLEQRLYEIRISKKHHLLGTAARYIARNRHDPNEIEIVLIWRNSIMPSSAERESALAAFYDDLADIIDWGNGLAPRRPRALARVGC